MMGKRFYPERVDGIRRLLGELPPGGLRPVEVATVVVRHLAEDCLYAAELEAQHAALRDAAQALVEALDTWNLGSYEKCEECDAPAASYVLWESDSAYLCHRHTEERRADKNLPPVLEIEDEPISAPLRAVRALLGGDQ